MFSVTSKILLNKININSIILIVTVFGGYSTTLRYVLGSVRDYCDPELCKDPWHSGSYLQHIACDNNDTIEDTCSADAFRMKMTTKRQELILHLHNSVRSRIAMGNLSEFETAAKMPMLKWDNELESLAWMNVKTCNFEHDNCHNIERGRYSGQNIGTVSVVPPYKSFSKKIRFAIASWFNEYKDANQTDIDYFIPPKNNK